MIQLANAVIPAIIGLILLAALRGRTDAYSDFCGGAKQGFGTALRLIPTLVAVMVTLGMLRSSGLLGLLTEALSPLVRPFGVPPEVLPAAVTRPLSASATLGVIEGTIANTGPDSLATRMSCALYGASETSAIVIAIYCGCVGLSPSRRLLTLCAIGDIVGITTAIALCNLVFSS